MQCLPLLPTPLVLSTRWSPPSMPLLRLSRLVLLVPFGVFSQPSVRARIWYHFINMDFWPSLPLSILVSVLHQSGKDCLVYSIIIFGFRWFHLFSTWIFAGLYSINTMIVYAIFGDERDEIYPFLNYAEKFGDALKFDIMMTFGVQSAVFLFIFALSHLKFFVHRKCLSKSGAQCRYNYCSCFTKTTENTDPESDPLNGRSDGFMKQVEAQGYTNCTYDVSYKSLPPSEI